jgi:hypothetical protein
MDTTQQAGQRQHAAKSALDGYRGKLSLLDNDGNSCQALQS